jgi:hypothetical protein
LPGFHGGNIYLDFNLHWDPTPAQMSLIHYMVPDVEPAKVSLFFIVDGVASQTIRQKELRHHYIRSHAARTSRPRRKMRPTIHGVWLPSPHIALSQHSTDPFVTTALGDVPDSISTMLERLWTEAMVPLRPYTAGHIHPDIYVWRQACISNELFSHCMVACAAIIALARGIPEDMQSWVKRAHVYHTDVALKLLRHQLKHSPVLSDELLMVVLGFSVHYSMFEDHEELDTGDPRSPLAFGHRLDLWGRMIPSAVHKEALGAIILRKGGFDSISMPGLTDFICLCETLTCTRTGMQPSIPFTGMKHLDHNLDAKAAQRASLLGKSLPRNDSQLHSVLLDICKLTVALDHYQRAEHHPPRFNDLVNFRTWVQYKLLALDGLPPSHEPYRLAALIYSDLNVWPMPLSAGVRPRLARELWIASSRYGDMGEDTDTSEADDDDDGLLWFITMGAIAARTTEFEPLFLRSLERRTRDLTWCEYRSRMLGYIWCDFIIEPVVKQLWVMVCKPI